MVARDAGGAVTARNNGTVSAANGTGLLIDPFGDVNVTIASGCSITGLTGVHVTAGANCIVNAGAIVGTAGATND